jgi:hypothetical protein
MAALNDLELIHRHGNIVAANVGAATNTWRFGVVLVSGQWP